MKHILFFILSMILCSSIYCQSNSIKYYAQYYNYGLNDLGGIRQTLAYSHGLSKKLSIELQVFTGSGRGKDISSNFNKDFIVLSENNAGNVPDFLNSFNDYYEGIYSYKRISNGLKQDNGWGISLNYKLLQFSKFDLNFSIGYLVYNTKAIIRDNIIDVKISVPNYPSIKDYEIRYPAAVHMNYDDGAAIANVNISYKFQNRLSLGLSTNFNYSMWNSGLDLGLGLSLTYNLNKI